MVCTVYCTGLYGRGVHLWPQPEALTPLPHLVHHKVLPHFPSSKFPGLCLIAGLGMVDRCLSPAVLGIHVRRRVIAPVSPHQVVRRISLAMDPAVLHRTVTELKLTSFCPRNRRRHIKRTANGGTLHLHLHLHCETKPTPQ